MANLFNKSILVLLLLSVCPVVLCAEDDDLTRTEFDGFSFCLPKGWKKTPPDREKTRAYLLHYGKSYFFANGLLKVDAGKPVDNDAIKVAKLLAGPDGKVDEKPIKIDGVDAYHVQTTSKDLSRPHLGMVIIREKTMYLIMAAAKNDFDPSDAFKTVVETWEWAK